MLLGGEGSRSVVNNCYNILIGLVGLCWATVVCATDTTSHTGKTICFTCHVVDKDWTRPAQWPLTMLGKHIYNFHKYEKFGYVTAWASNDITIVDQATSGILVERGVASHKGEAPVAIRVHPTANVLFVANTADGSVTQ